MNQAIILAICRHLPVFGIAPFARGDDAVDAVIVTVDEREVILFRLGDDVQAALGLNSPGLRVLGVVAAPYRVLAQRVEGVAEHGGQCFGHVSLTPERPADPVSEFQRVVAKVLAVAFGEFRIGGNGVGGALADGLERDAAHRRVAVRRAALDGNGPVVFDREDIAYVMHAALDAGVWRPAASQPDFRVAGIPEQRCRLSRVIDLPRAQQQSFGLDGVHGDSSRSFARRVRARITPNTVSGGGGSCGRMPKLADRGAFPTENGRISKFWHPVALCTLDIPRAQANHGTHGHRNQTDI